jgi:hypothetical protein
MNNMAAARTFYLPFGVMAVIGGNVGNKNAKFCTVM